MNPLRLYFLLIITLLCGISSMPSWAQSPSPLLQTLVIDAGHGGKDPGTTSRNYREKDITLAVALKLGERIQSLFPSLKIIYTRSDDTYLRLEQRSKIANKANADLLISIHVNGAESHTAHGTETFIMGSHKSSENLKVAMRENDVITLDKDFATQYNGYQPGSAESYIIFSLTQYAYNDQSLKLASLIQQAYCSNTQLTNRGVKQAGFLVLWDTAMPSVLTEIGFVTNPDDEKFIASETGQDKIVQSLCSAFTAYKTQFENETKSGLVAATRQTESLKDDSVTNSRNTIAAQIPDRPQTNIPIYYQIQIKSSSQKIPRNSYEFKTYRNKIREVVSNGCYKYYVGKAASYKDALSLQKEVRKSFQDAFVVAFRGEDPLPLNEAKRIQ